MGNGIQMRILATEVPPSEYREGGRKRRCHAHTHVVAAAAAVDDGRRTCAPRGSPFDVWVALPPPTRRTECVGVACAKEETTFASSSHMILGFYILERP